MFDILVDIFHEELVARGLITHRQEDLSDRLEDSPTTIALSSLSSTRRTPPLRKDFAPRSLPRAIRSEPILRRPGGACHPITSATPMSDATLLGVDRMLNGGRFESIIRTNLHWRSIGEVRIGPRLKPPGPKTHFDLPRVFVPPAHHLHLKRRPSFRERYLTAHGWH